MHRAAEQEGFIPPGSDAELAKACASPDRLSGAALIYNHVPTLPNRPGVYRMLDAKGEVLYVGKAKSLKKSLPAYAKPSGLSARLQRMVALTHGLEVVTTASDVEALLLECNMIKRHRPPFNIVLRDDKSFPYIYVGKPSAARSRFRGSAGTAAPSARTATISVRSRRPARSTRRSPPCCGRSRCAPAPTASSHNRTRPCLQYQIKRCTAPCVGRIGQADYAQLLDQTRAFLAGRSDAIQDQLKAAMADASERLEFEQAAAIRDRLKALAHISSRQGINVSTVDDADVIALAQDGGQACVQVFFYRGGRNYGNRAYYPSHVHDAEAPELLDAFLGQFYAERSPPKLILLSHTPASLELLTEALAVRAGRKVTLLRPQRGEKRQLVEQAEQNARHALARKLAESSAQAKLLGQLADRLGLPEVPGRIEVYDNSHIMGTDALGAFIVAGPEGLNKSAYRRFLIRSTDLAPGDDYAMMREVLGRRFGRLQREDPGRQSRQWPDLVIIDGGAGQLGAALETLGGLRDLGAAGPRDRQRPRPRRRPGDAASARPAALQAGPARSGPVLLAATPGRGASLCDHQPPGTTRQRGGTFGARSGGGCRRQTQEGAARPLRLGARDRNRRPARSGARSRNQQGGCQGRLRCLS